MDITFLFLEETLLLFCLLLHHNLWKQGRKEFINFLLIIYSLFHAIVELAEYLAYYINGDVS